jgi:Calcineurin-like phosphoesterase
MVSISAIQTSFIAIIFVVSMTQTACVSLTPSHSALQALFTVRGAEQTASVRVIARAASCPQITWDDHAPHAMAVRVAADSDPIPTVANPLDRAAARFDVLTCEATWPLGARRAHVLGQRLTAPVKDPQTIVIIADTGCRMKAADNAFQACNDASKWPFAQIASSAVAQNPDLVVHIGDMHYRESPCPSGNAGCAGSPWGYGFDTWNADLFEPGKALLSAAPWVFVRGNHESCARAGQGWFRFIDAQAFSPARSCNDPARDLDADFSDPYAVTIAADTQLIVFDSSKSNAKAYSAKDPAFVRYVADMDKVKGIAKHAAQNIFLSHHPVLAVAPSRADALPKLGGSAGLQSVLSNHFGSRLFPDSVGVAMHGHLHYFESLSFTSDHPASIVMGNSGSANEGRIPQRLPVSFEPYPKAVVSHYAARSDYGFAVLKRADASAAHQWTLTEFTAAGKAVVRCAVSANVSHCVDLD